MDYYYDEVLLFGPTAKNEILVLFPTYLARVAVVPQSWLTRNHAGSRSCPLAAGWAFGGSPGSLKDMGINLG